MSRKPLGEILVESGVLRARDVLAALREQLRWGGPLGRILVDMRLVSEDVLVRALSTQLGVAAVRLAGREIPHDVISSVPAAMAGRHEIVPFAMSDNVLDVAMPDPTRTALIDELELHSHMTVRAHIAGPKDLENAVAKYYQRGAGMLDLTLGKAGVRSSSATSSGSPDSFEETSGMIVVDENSRAALADSLPDEPSVRTVDTEVAPPSQRSPTASRESASQQEQVPEVTFERLTEVVRTLRKEVRALQTRVSTLESLLGRDEDVLRKVITLLVEKRVATRDEILARLK